MSNKGKGFTLIELLAVIVILAIIALIATPIVMNLISKARIKAAEDSALGYIKATENYLAFSLLEPNENKIEDGSYYVSELVDVTVSGNKPTNDSWINIEDNKIVSCSLKINNYVINCDESENKVRVTSDELTEKPSKYEMLKNMNGINWYFDSDNATEGSTVWQNRISDNNSFTINAGIVLDDDSVYINGSASSILRLETFDSVTVYIVGKTNSNTTNFLITGNGSVSSNLICMATSNNKLSYAYYINSLHYASNVSASKYNVMAVSYDAVNKVSKYYINGALAYTGPNNGYFEPNYWLVNYATYLKNWPTWYKMVAIGNQLHTDNEIQENMSILMEKYNIE